MDKLKLEDFDWGWCPVYKGTSKQHICQKSITPDMVMEKFNSWIK